MLGIRISGQNIIWINGCLMHWTQVSRLPEDEDEVMTNLDEEYDDKMKLSDETCTLCVEEFEDMEECAKL